MRRILGAALYLAFLGLTLEIALQAFYFATAGDFLFKRVGLPIYVADPHAGFFVKPELSFEHHTNEFSSQVHTNRQGLRVPRGGIEYAKTPADSTYRVMLLGPSFAFGWGVDYEETFAAFLEEQLAARHFGGAERVEVINAGVPALPPRPHLEWFQNVGAEFAPDLVIQFMYGSMLPSRRTKEHYSVTSDGYLVPPNLTWKRQLQTTVKKSATVFYSWIVYTRLKPRLSGAPAADQVQGAGRDMAAVQVFDPDDPEIRHGLAYYEQLRQSTRASGAELLVVYFPLSYVVHPEDMGRWQHLGVKDVEGQIAFNRDFCHHLIERGFDCVDVSGDLIGAARAGERLYFWLDIHWTARGNQVTAESVATHLERSEVSSRL